MSENVHELRPANAAPPEVVGYVEAVTQSAALGWAWLPGHEERLVVELRAGDQTIAQSVADQVRDDLLRSGIGDGAHAFTLPIPDAYRAQRDTLSVAVALPEGRCVVLSTPSAAKPEHDKLSQLLKSVDAMIGSQRVLHRNLQAALTQPGAGPSAPLAELAAAQARLEQGFETLEKFVFRIEQALHGGERMVSDPRTRSRGVWVALAVSIAALVGSAVALAMILGGR